MGAMTAITSKPVLAPAPVLVEVAALTKRYRDELALGDVSFDMRAGEVLGLIGPNGAGKTTLLEAIAGVLPADAGSIRWRGAPLPSARRRDFMFYLPDGLRPWDDQYAGRVIDFFAAVHRRRASEVAGVIGSVGLWPVLGKRVSALSKGYVRRLMLALALITPHPLLLMDEPFDGFDLRQTREMMRLIRGVAVLGRTLVLAIHQLADAERVCDRFVLLAGGRIRGSGTLDDLRVRTGLASARLEDVFLALT
jgi:ABC-type multidrug transport system ATPase subunit